MNMPTFSYTTHTIISISLHLVGVFVGLFVWYLFPKHPTRSIVQLPSERVALVIEPRTVIVTQPEDIIYSPIPANSGKLIDIDESVAHIPAIRNFG